MTGFRKLSERSNLSTAMLLLMIVAFAVKAVIPAGFMPGVANGMATMVICSGTGEKTITVPADQNAPTSDHKERHMGDLCTYQVASLGKLIVPILLTFIIPVTTQTVPHLYANAETHYTFTKRAHTVRGPPSSR